MGSLPEQLAEEVFTRARGSAVGQIALTGRESRLEDDLEVSAMVHAPNGLHGNQSDPTAGSRELEFPRLSLLSWVTLHPRCLGGPAVTGGWHGLGGCSGTPDESLEVKLWWISREKLGLSSLLSSSQGSRRSEAIRRVLAGGK